MTSGGNDQGNIAASLSALFQAAISTIHTRLELFAVEYQEEKIRLVELVVLAAAVMAFGTIALGLLTLAVVLAFPDPARLYALVAFGLGYLSAGAVAYRALSARLSRTGAFPATLDEIRKDRECLQAKS